MKGLDPIFTNPALVGFGRIYWRVFVTLWIAAVFGETLSQILRADPSPDYLRYVALGVQIGYPVALVLALPVAGVKWFLQKRATQP